MSDYEMERWPDDKLLRAANRGNTDAFVTFCVKRLPSLVKYVRFQCRTQEISSDLIDDFCHDTIVRAVEYIDSCREHGDRPLPKVSVAWIKQIAHNVIQDWRRKNTRITFVDEVVATARPELDPDKIDEYEEILKFFQWLSDNERDMLEMVLVDGRDILEAGETLGLSSSAAYKTYERGLGTLRDLLREHGQFFLTASDVAS